MTITPHLFEAFLKCPTKCRLRAAGESPTGSIYAEWVQSQNESYRAAESKRLITETPADKCASSRGSIQGNEAPFSAEGLKTAKWHLAVDVLVRTPESLSSRSSRGNEAQTSLTGINQSFLKSAATIVESRLHAVERIPSEGRGKAAQFIPIRFIFRNKLTMDDRLLLGFDALVLSEMLGREVSLGRIIHGEDHATLKVKTSALAGEVQKRLEKIGALLSSPTPPDLVLNRHCAECEFRDRCRQKALETDDLSLLAGMSAKERQKLRGKGIFTVTQLSYTFRPRRRPKRLRDKREKYHHSLKALAIREKKIHIVGSPELKIEGTPVYLDVEGLPDRDFYYLIGVRIGNGDSAVQHSLWADTVEDEGKIWREFLGILDRVEKPVLIHYGSYETTFTRSMSNRHGSPRAGSIAATAVDAMVNILSFVFAQIYFPTPSNNLKTLVGWLGFAWPDPALFGPNSICFRVEWQRSRENAIRESLIAYNVADCEALQFLCKHLSALAHDQSPNLQKARMDLVNVDQIKQVSRFHLINKDGAALPAFKAINKAAYWDYQRTRVYVRTSKIIKKACRQTPGARPKQLPVRETARYPAPCSCSHCGGSNLFRGRTTNLLVHDIRFMRSGAKGWLTWAILDNWFCPNCRCLVRPPGIGAFAVRKFGPHLRAYAMYQLIQLRISGITVAESLSRLFHFDLNGPNVSAFKSDFAGLYTKTVQELTTRMARGSLVHADETKVRLVGKSGFVWVLASLEDVVFLYSDTRAGDMVQELLKDFHGVLISDFYAVYDAINCLQQKCLIHLMRDINDDLHKYPYDEDLRSIASEYAGLIKPMVETVDKQGLKRRFLAKHQAEVEAFFRWLLAEKFDSEIAQGYRKRFQKNREKLFTFLAHDGVLWNNNNAENAIRAFAELRRVIGGTCTEKGLREYLVLMSICETCKRRGISFLDFMLSEETNIEKLASGRSSHFKVAPDKERQCKNPKPRELKRGSKGQTSESRVPEEVSPERRNNCHPGEVAQKRGDCSRDEALSSDAPNPEIVRVVNDRCVVRTQDGHRVVIVSGIVLAEYALADRVGEAHAMVSLVEQGLADQNDVSRAFGCSARTVRRYQRRFEDGGLAALRHGRSYTRGRGCFGASRRQLVQHLKTQGHSDREIARHIGVSEKAVRNLVRRLRLRGGT